MSFMKALAVMVLGAREECPAISESATMGVAVLFSTLFIVVLLFVLVLKRRMATLEVGLLHKVTQI